MEPPLGKFESIVKLELSSSFQECEAKAMAFESIVKLELSSSTNISNCGIARLRVLLN